MLKPPCAEARLIIQKDWRLRVGFTCVQIALIQSIERFISLGVRDTDRRHHQHFVSVGRRENEVSLEVCEYLQPLVSRLNSELAHKERMSRTERPRPKTLNFIHDLVHVYFFELCCGPYPVRSNKTFLS